MVRLLPNGAQDRKLRRIADAASKLWNELNYERRQDYFEVRKQGLSERASLRCVDFDGTRKRIVPKYTGILGASAWEVERKNWETWSAFRGLLKARAEGRLPPWTRISPPGYRKDGETRRRKLWIPVRHEMYTVDPEPTSSTSLTTTSGCGSPATVDWTLSPTRISDPVVYGSPWMIRYAFHQNIIIFLRIGVPIRRRAGALSRCC